MSVRADDLARRPSVSTWALGGFLAGWTVCGLALASGATWEGRPWLPTSGHPGGDMRIVLACARAWWDGLPMPGIGNTWPPLSLLLLTPLLAVDPATAYGMIVLLTIVGHCLAALWLPPRFEVGSGSRTTLLASAASGLVSYPLWFTLERGQIDVVVMGAALLGVHLFHHRPHRRWLAYWLLSAAIQLKIYPAIFVLALVDRGEGLGRHARRAALVLAANAAALVALGWETFRAFVATQATFVATAEVSEFNQSLHSFAYGTVPRLERWRVPLLPDHPWIVVATGLALLAACLGDRVLAIHRRGVGPSPYLLLACTIAALVVPPVGYNYRLVILVTPMAALLLHLARTSSRPSPSTDLVVAGMLAAYAVVLVPPALRPPLLRNSLPLLAALLAGTMILARREERAVGQRR